MTIQHHSRARYVIGPDGCVLTVADLPPRNTKRWVIRRKAELVAAVRGGLLTLEEACERYTLTVDDFLSWQRTLDRHGLPGRGRPACKITANDRRIPARHASPQCNLRFLASATPATCIGIVGSTARSLRWLERIVDQVGGDLPAHVLADLQRIAEVDAAPDAHIRVLARHLRDALELPLHLGIGKIRHRERHRPDWARTPTP